MKCRVCKRPLGSGDRVVPVLRIIGPKRDGFGLSQPDEFIHVHHLTERSTS